MKKLLITLAIFFIAANLSAQRIYPDNREVDVDFSLHLVKQDYLFTGMILFTFSTLQMFGNDMTKKQRDTFAISCISATTVTFITINFDDIFKKGGEPFPKGRIITQY